MKKKGSALGSSSSTEHDAAEPQAVIGRLGRPNGLKGFLGIYVEDEDLVHLEVGSTVFVDGDSYTVSGLRRGKRGHEIAFEEISDRPGAEAIRGNDVKVYERRQLTEDEFWPDQLIGLDVRPGGGKVVAVVSGASQDRLVVERNGDRFEVPFVDELVPVVDLEGSFVEIAEIEGLSSPADR